MTLRETRSPRSRRDLRRQPLLVRETGRRCDFCGRLTTTVAVASAPEARGALICPSCIERAARELLRPGGGDAA
ncbi:MAG TPA: hypothetical protein VNH20_03675 [Candidatus Dormibacteraeota bacterium]|nr:hypothetical protein [Candidatus Dormibacteraeota bacterium]